MRTATENDPPPESRDVEGWRRAVNEGHYIRYRLEDIVAAIQDLGPSTDTSVLNPLAQHLSDSLQRILRRRVSVNHPNRGLDIIEGTHGRIIEAVLQPETADGRALRVAFVARVAFRIKNTIASEAFARNGEQKEAARLPGHEATAETQPPANEPLPHYDPTSDLLEHMNVEHLLERISNNRKRLLFRLFMDGIPLQSTKSASITESLGICDGTARVWLKDIREYLSRIPAVQEILESKTRGSRSETL